MKLLIVFFLIVLVLFLRKKENFPYPIMSPSTRNMSYDLRGDPDIPTYKRHPIIWLPFRLSSLFY